LEAETANKNEQNLDDSEDYCVNVDDIKVEEEKSGDELQNEDAIKVVEFSTSPPPFSSSFSSKAFSRCFGIRGIKINYIRT